VATQVKERGEEGCAGKKNSSPGYKVKGMFLDRHKKKKRNTTLRRNNAMCKASTTGNPALQKKTGRREKNYPQTNKESPTK